MLKLVETIIKLKLRAERRERLQRLGYDDVDIDFITGEGVGPVLGFVGEVKGAGTE